MTKQKVFIFACLPLILTACGKGDDNNAGTSNQVISSNAVSTGHYPGTDFPVIEIRYGSFTVSYSFYENGCYTGRHRVSSYDQESTRQLLCQRLQEDWSNRGCARGMRQAYFASVCSGVAWSPI